MTDIIWTLILIWLFFRLTSLFTGRIKTQSDMEERAPERSNSNRDESLRRALRKRIDKEGDYVDYEELK